MSEALRNFIVQSKEYLPHFKTVQESEEEPKRNCFFRACKLYFQKVLKIDLEQQDFTTILDKVVPGTYFWEGISLLERVASELGYRVVLNVLQEEHAERINNLHTLVGCNPCKETEIEVVPSFKEQSCIVFLHNQTTTWLPASHYDVVLSENYKLLEIAYAVIYITKP